MKNIAFLFATATAATIIVLPSPAFAQQVDAERQGKTAETSVGEVGQRQEEDAVSTISTADRINNRIYNRLQNRIRNRIDRDYDPYATTTSSYERADERARTSGQPRPR